LIGPLLGEKGLFRVRFAEQKIFSKLGKLISYFLKSYMIPLYLLKIVFPTFDPLTAAGMALYLKMSQNVKIYLA
jgi:hypothetical protein